VRLAGIQPGYLPWLGYFDQMARVDRFVIADQMPYSSSGWAHRNRVRGPAGEIWLRLPVRRPRGRPIDEVALDRAVPWRRTHLRTLRQNYARSPYAAEELDRLETVLDQEATRLVDVSLATVRFLADRLGIDTPVVVSSELDLEARYAERFPERPGPTHRVIAFLEALGADELLEGDSGRAYLDVDLCARHGITVRFHDYRHPTYAQLHSPFLSHLSALDLLLAVGVDEARQVLRQGSRTGG
jgi:hypothetical protein